MGAVAEQEGERFAVAALFCFCFLFLMSLNYCEGSAA